MQTRSMDETIATMNERATSRRPFVFVISFDMDQNLVVPADEATASGLYMQMPGWQNHTFVSRGAPDIQLIKHPVSREKYRKAFGKVRDEIRYGNTFLLNLTFPTPVETTATLQDLFAAGRSTYKLLLENRVAVFSPESFVRIRGRTISSNPMKGTRDATVPGAYTALATDKKEDAEHSTIVDLIRNDLSRVSDNVRVKRFKYIDKIRTHQGELLQMSSEITGKLPGDFRSRLGEVIFQLLPAGSISGAPKRKTLEIIAEVETYERGYYTGIFGYFDGENLDSAVAIRFLERQGDMLMFKSGGGITYQSEWETEYEEMIQKVYVPVY